MKKAAGCLGSEQIKDTRHFRLHYYLRQAPEQECSGTCGVRHLNLIWCYVQALDSLYDTLVNPPFRWKKRPRKLIDVYLLDTMQPCAVPGGAAGDHHIILPSRYEEPDMQHVRRRAAVNAVHEATHMFCFQARRLESGLAGLAWRWLHEATAVFMEGYMFPDNPEANRFALDWVDQPHAALDAPAPSPWLHQEAYHAGWFLRYLVKRFDPSLIGRLWNANTVTGEQPFQTLHRLLQAPPWSYQGMLDPTGKFSPLFSEYCFDSYHLNDFHLPSFAPDLHARFRGRALRSWRRLSPGGPGMEMKEVELANLACHYHRIDAGPGTTHVHLRLTHDGRCPLSVALSVADRDRHRGKQVLTQSNDSGQARLCLDLAGEASIDHLVACVANPGLEVAHRTEYRLEITAH